MIYVVLDDSIKSKRFRERLLPRLLEKAGSVEVTILDPAEANNRSLGDYLAWYPLIFKETPTREFFLASPANWDDEYLIKPIELDYNENDILDWYQGKARKRIKLDVDNLAENVRLAGTMCQKVLDNGLSDNLERTEEKRAPQLRDIKDIEKFLEKLFTGVFSAFIGEKTEESD
jgi:hypothetical protein